MPYICNFHVIYLQRAQFASPSVNITMLKYPIDPYSKLVVMRAWEGHDLKQIIGVELFRLHSDEVTMHSYMYYTKGLDR